MPEPTKEQIQWLLGRCGFKYHPLETFPEESAYRSGVICRQPYWTYPDGTNHREVPSPVGSLEFLGFLFKYPVPKMNEPKNELYSIEFTYNKPNGSVTCEIKRELDLTQGRGKTEAPALFWAIFTALGGK